MELDKIETLLEKYFEGATSIPEENQLKAYFSGSNVAQQLEQYKPLFGYFIASKQQAFPQDVPLETQQPIRKKSIASWLSVAASVVLLLGAGTFTYFNYDNQQNQGLGTYDDPEVAFRETQKALSLLSENVNVGVEGMQYLQQYEDTKSKVFN